MICQSRLNELKAAYDTMFPGKSPDQTQWLVWAFIYEYEDLHEALGQLAIRHQKLSGKMTPNHMIRFTSTVANRLKNERRESVEQHPGNDCHRNTPDGLVAVPVSQQGD